MALQAIWGTTQQFALSVKKSDGSAYDLSNASEIFFTVKYSFSDLDSAAVAQLTIGAGLSITDTVGGLLTATFAASVFAVLPPDTRTKLVYDVKLIDISGEPYDIAGPDEFDVMPVVTRAIV